MAFTPKSSRLQQSQSFRIAFRKLKTVLPYRKGYCSRHRILILAKNFIMSLINEVCLKFGEEKMYEFCPMQQQHELEELGDLQKIHKKIQHSHAQTIAKAYEDLRQNLPQLNNFYPSSRIEILTLSMHYILALKRTVLKHHKPENI